MKEQDKAEVAIIAINAILQSIGVDEAIAQHQAYHLVKSFIDFTDVNIERFNNCSENCVKDR